VNVYWNGRLRRTVDLYSATRVDRRRIQVAFWWNVHAGTLTIEVASSGRKVILDGVAIARATW
jgi:hypothetical protein